MERKLTTPELDTSIFLVSVEDENDTNRQTLSHSHSPLVLLGKVTNRYVRDSSRLFQKDFGIGVMEWRMLVILTRKPSASVTESSRIIGIDKGAVSRALARLETKGLAATASETRRKWHLTDAGRAMHEEILAVSLRLHQRLLDGFSTEEVFDLNSFLHRIMENLETPEPAGG
ncbi:MAG: MarR family transcriptional regulator [Rhodospirillaceae bacterium]|jgi:DNA-binding MarR family transcriptional regulator|nr:MarR family transcriptional regulator [Rhodospirillaceae bacterium]